jgi:2-aminoadipate transaminase
MQFEWKFSRASNRMGSSIIREILKLLRKKNVISLAGGIPDPKLLPLAQITEATQQVLKNNGCDALQYGTTEGYLPLREFLAERLNNRGIKADAGNILITSGSQQGLDLIGKVFVDPEDVVITEKPTYLGLIQSFTAYQSRFCSLPIDEQGMQIDLLEEALQRYNPCLIYVLPNFQNPAGVTIPLERRQRIAELSVKYQVPVVEDDPYGELRYYGEHLPAIKSLACAENTIMLGTISKIISPGHRLGWVVAREEVIKRLVLAKQAADLHSNTFSQRVIYEFCRQGHLDGHIEFLCREYCKKRDVMLTALDKYFPPDIKWTKPAGGLFLWVTLPEGMSSTRILKESIQQGVAFVPGSAFFPDGDGDNTLRLSFSSASLDELDLGIERLAGVLKRHLGKP